MLNYLRPIIIFFAIIWVLPSNAQEWDERNPVDIEIIDESGRVFEQYPLSHEGRRHKTNKAYLQARRGESYSIRVRNRTQRRIGLVIAVDGRNIISGDQSFLASNERMYILAPYQQATYEGWRTAKNWVNEFYFTDAADSYAEAWGDRSAMGVIAVAVYSEKEAYRPWRREERINENRAQHAPGAQSQAPGTGFGDEDWSPSRKVDFDPEQRPQARYFIKYEWRSTLCRKGIIDCHKSRRPRNRFWDDDDENRYAPYPPNYRN
ncbi:MAG: hypothetical protein R3F37_21325 [Candidatus Competibacteraceae bacterium]